jgi:hypothetical protein
MINYRSIWPDALEQRETYQCLPHTQNAACFSCNASPHQHQELPEILRPHGLSGSAKMSAATNIVEQPDKNHHSNDDVNHGFYDRRDTGDLVDPPKNQPNNTKHDKNVEQKVNIKHDMAP